MSNALLDLVKRYTDAQPGQSPFATAIDGMTILRSDHEKPHSHLIFKPALCVVVQGAKWSTFGDRKFEYRAGQALVVSVEMPALSRVVKASPAAPYLSVVIEFDLAVMREVTAALASPPTPRDPLGHGVFVTNFDGTLADCVLRMVRLLDTRVTVESTRAVFGGRLPDILHTDRIGAAEVADLHALGTKVYMNAVPLDRYFQPFRYFATRSLLETGLDFVLTGNPLSVMRKVAAAHPAR